MEQNQTQGIWSSVFRPLGVLKLRNYIRIHLKDHLLIKQADIQNIFFQDYITVFQDKLMSND